jgi:hypothetical protein
VDLARSLQIVFAIGHLGVVEEIDLVPFAHEHVGRRKGEDLTNQIVIPPPFRPPRLAPTTAAPLIIIGLRLHDFLNQFALLVEPVRDLVLFLDLAVPLDRRDGVPVVELDLVEILLLCRRIPEAEFGLVLGKCRLRQQRCHHQGQSDL